MEKFSFIFLRHGESEANLKDIFQGQSESNLTERGKMQVSLLGERWKAEGRQFDAIISSPLLRAKQTAEIIQQKLNCPLELDPVWKERDTGKLTGMNRQDYFNSNLYHDFFTPYQSMGEIGESDFELFLRGGRALDSLLKRNTGDYLVVSHGGLLNQVLHVIIGTTPQANGQGITFRLVNTGFAELRYDPCNYKWTLISFNDYAHLSTNDVDRNILEL